MKLWVHEYISHLKDFFITPGILRKDFFAYVINIVQRDNLDLFLKDLKVIRRKCFGNVFRKMDKHLETYTKEKTTELDNNIEAIEKRMKELSTTVEKVKAISNQNNKAKISDLINTILDEYRSINITMNTLYSIVDKLSDDCAKSLMPLLDSN